MNASHGEASLCIERAKEDFRQPAKRREKPLGPAYSYRQRGA